MVLLVWLDYRPFQLRVRPEKEEKWDFKEYQVFYRFKYRTNLISKKNSKGLDGPPGLKGMGGLFGFPGLKGEMGEMGYEGTGGLQGLPGLDGNAVSFQTI